MTATPRNYWPTQLLLGWLNLVLAAPTIYLYMGLPLVMRQHGWSGTEIGLFQLAGVPVMLKFILATPIDRWKLGHTNYRNWGILLFFGHIAALLALATQDIQSANYWSLFTLAMLASLLGTWADVPVNALAIQYLPESERMRAGAVRSAVTGLSAIIGGGLMLVVQTRMGWAWPFWILSGCMLSGVLLMLLFIRIAGNPAQPVASLAPRVGIKHWVSYFTIPKHCAWLPLLLLYFPFLGATWLYIKPLLLDHGFPPENVAWLAGVLGGLVAAGGSMAGGALAKHGGLRRALPICAVLGLVAVSALALAVANNASPSVLIAVVVLIAIAMGANASLVFGLMMYHTRADMNALDYGIQSSLFALMRALIPILMGVILDRLGYVGMLTSIVIALAVVLLFVMRYLRVSPLIRPAANPIR